MISSQERQFCHAKELLITKFGPADSETPFLKFNFTDYYQKEFGRNLLRKFISFKKLVDPSRLCQIKIFTNEVEQKLARKDGSRRINLDPGYITESNLILATTKAFQHRIYLNKGIYAEVTLKFTKGGFEPYDWTYPDYRTKAYTDFFKQVRTLYREQLSLWKRQRNIGG